MSSSFSFDDGGSLSILQALRNPRNAQKVANAAAESYVDDTLDWIAEGRSFTSREGQLQQNINWRPLTNGEAEVCVNSGMHVTPGEDGAPDRLIEFGELAWYIETGTRPHVIGPKPGRKGVKMNVTGGEGYIIRRQFNHPGTSPMPFFFADLPDRAERMKARGLSVLAGIIHG